MGHGLVKSWNSHSYPCEANDSSYPPFPAPAPTPTWPHTHRKWKLALLFDALLPHPATDEGWQREGQGLRERGSGTKGILTLWNCSCKRSSAPSTSIMRFSNTSCKTAKKRKKRKFANWKQNWTKKKLRLRYIYRIYISDRSQSKWAKRVCIFIYAVHRCVCVWVCVYKSVTRVRSMNQSGVYAMCGREFLSVCVCL